MTKDTHIRFEAIEACLPDLTLKFCSARPFEHVIFDEFLHASSLDLLQSEIARPLKSNRSNDYLFAKNKFENPSFAEVGGIMAEIKSELLSERFAKILSRIYGKLLFIDPNFLGGGIHQGGQGSYLDMHADFSRHPMHKDWLRVINVLLYLNRNYNVNYGGNLELQHDKSGERSSIAPIENRLVLMLTSGHTLHGYKSINFPEGTFRTSLAAYAYMLDTDFELVPARTTLWSPQDGGVGKLIVARLSPMFIKVKHFLLGSGTVRRATRASASLNKKTIKKK